MSLARSHHILLILFTTASLILTPAAAWAQTASDGSGSASEDLLGYGSAGPEVEQWQQQLNAWLEEEDAERAPLTVDGIFGRWTQAVTMAFQEAHGVTVDGTVGSETRGVLEESDGDGELQAEDVLSEGIDTRADTGEPGGPAVAITDVRVASHEGFDRVTFEIGGEGRAGWQARYVDEARAQGSGNAVDVAGDAVLSVSLQTIGYPTDAPEGVQPWDGPQRMAPDGSGPIHEVVEDTVFEGHQVFFIGVDGELPFQVRRFGDPQRVVVDVAASDVAASEEVASGGSELPGGDLVRCEHPDGFAVSYPHSWHTTEGPPLGPCSQFNPEPFEVPLGTDARGAAITAFIDPVPFHEVATPDFAREIERAATTIDGLQAVRLEREVTEGLWPEGTRVTSYIIDLTPGVDEDPETLFLDTVELSQFDYERNTVVLDRMARTLEITRQDVPTDTRLVARYEGGGGALRVEGDVTDGQACLHIPPNGEDICTDVPGPAELLTVQLDDLGPVLAGVTGEEVFAVTAERQDASPSTVLPAPVGDTDVRGFAFTFGPDAVERLVTTDITGAQLETIEPG